MEGRITTAQQLSIVLGVASATERSRNMGFVLNYNRQKSGTPYIIPNKNQNTRHKSFLFPFFCVKNYFYSLLRQAQHKLQYKEFLPCKRKIYSNLFIGYFDF